MNAHPASRRRFLALQGAFAATALLSKPATGQGLDDKRPQVASLESGDFIWPKQPSQYVPFNSGSTMAYADEKATWLAERRQFIAAVRADPSSTLEDRQFASDLEFMDFSEFLTLYQADLSPGSPREFAGGVSPLYVGHVGIIQIANGKVDVVEAVWGKGVQRISYADWLAGRPDAWVWHGRLSGKTRAERSRIAEEAARHVSTRYNFWNFDLLDSTGFYCSKLCWHATQRALGVALDDNPNARRRFWFSPKQMLKARSVDKLFSPGSYTF